MKIILINPQLAENIGACARAMWNCGLADLRLVAPRDGWPQEGAWPAASGADQLLDRAELYPDLASAVADCQFVLATTARDRDQHKPVLHPTPAMQETKRRISEGQQVAVIFGPERAGLTNLHLQHANALIQIPLNPAYTSLNLAQAVLLIGWEFWQQQSNPNSPRTVIPATQEELEYFLQRLAATLEAQRFFTSDTQKPTMIQNLRNIFLRNDLTSQEVQTLQGVLTALIKQ